MKTSSNKSKEEDAYQVSLPSNVYNLLLSKPKSVDTIALLTFYCNTALWQGTNQPKATNDFCIKGLGMGWRRFDNAKRILKQLKLISQIQRRGDEDKFGNVFIKLNFDYKYHRTVSPAGNNTDADDFDLESNSHNDGKSPLTPKPLTPFGVINTRGDKKSASPASSGLAGIKTNSEEYFIEFDICPHDRSIGKKTSAYSCKVCPKEVSNYCREITREKINDARIKRACKSFIKYSSHV